MCKCIEEIKEKIKETYPDTYHDLKDPYGFTVSGNKIVTRASVSFLYRKKKKDGELTTKQFELPVITTHCPFCGGKYEEL